MLKGLIHKILRVDTTEIDEPQIEKQINGDLNEELEKTMNAIHGSGLLNEISEILNHVNFHYDHLNDKITEIRDKLIPDELDSTVRIVRWDGKVITQKGTVISNCQGIMEIDTMTGEYGVEVVLSQKPKEQVKFKILWIGLDYAGKTTLLHKLRYNEYIAPKRTVGQELEDVVIEGLKITNIDLGGQKALRQHWTKFPLIPQVIVYVIDILDENRFKESYSELKSKIIDNDRFDGIPILIIVNKIDDYKHDKDPVAYLTENIDLFKLMGERSWQIEVVSALTGKGLDGVIDSLTKFLLDTETR